MVRPKVPASDSRRLEFCRYLEASQKALKQGTPIDLVDVLAGSSAKSEPSDTNALTYPFTSGTTLVNDGVGYGEEVAETVLVGTNQLRAEARMSVRTRTGKYRRLKPKETAAPSKAELGVKRRAK